MRVESVVLICFLASACTQPNAGLRTPVTLPRIGTDSPSETVPRDVPTVSTGDPALSGDSNAVPQLTPVTDAVVNETDALEAVNKLKDQQGEAALAQLTPGDTLLTRVQYLYAQLLLGEPGVVAQLEQLSVKLPDNPIVWRLMGHAQDVLGDREDAVSSTRRAYELDAPGGFATCPSLPVYLAGLLVSAESTVGEGVRMLRQELADGHFPGAAALRLLDLFREQERHDEALLCLNQAIERTEGNIRDGLELQAAIVLMEVGRFEESSTRLEAMLESETHHRDAEMWYVRAKLFARDYPRVVSLIDTYLVRPDLDEQDRETYIETRKQAVRALDTGARLVSTFEFAALIRGGKDLDSRSRALKTMATRSGPDAAGFKVEDARLAVFIAFRTEEPTLRAEALRLGIAVFEDPDQVLLEGLRDPDAFVRGMAAALVSELDPRPTSLEAPLMARLSVEADAYVFRQLHEALRVLTGADILLPFGAAENPEGRQKIAQQWRDRS